jgi:hypothetical protein
MERRGKSAVKKRGQISIFVIVAIVIVAAILIYFFVPGARVFIGGGEVNPSSYLRDCIEPAVDEISETLYSQGGYAEPDSYVTYQDKRIQYLCYSAENYKPCLIMQPLLKQHVEGEIKKYVEPRARQCVLDLKEQYEKQGYEVTATQGELVVSFVPDNLVLEFLSPMTITKDTTQNFQKFGVSIESEMYDVLLTAVSILQFESTLGDSELTLYTQYYPDFTGEKIKIGEDTIYIIGNVISGERFSFATRSLVWPSGYGLEAE